jgi:hypothetical protein
MKDKDTDVGGSISAECKRGVQNLVAKINRIL